MGQHPRRVYKANARRSGYISMRYLILNTPAEISGLSATYIRQYVMPPETQSCGSKVSRWCVWNDGDVKLLSLLCDVIIDQSQYVSWQCNISMDSLIKLVSIARSDSNSYAEVGAEREKEREKKERPSTSEWQVKCTLSFTLLQWKV